MDRALGSARRIVRNRLAVNDQVPQARRGSGGHDHELAIRHLQRDRGGPQGDAAEQPAMKRLQPQAR